MFLRSLVVPPTPPSLVKFRSIAVDVITGSASSALSSDHVPELRNAASSRVGTDATADAVSWRAGGVDDFRRRHARREQLEQGVNRQELDAGDGVNPFPADALEHRLHHPFG